MFGINGGEFIVIVLVALLVIGPERLPDYAAQLGRFVRQARRMATGAREQVRAEIGPEFDEVDWRKLDPRQYDPRRIVKEALTDTFDESSATPQTKPKTRSGRRRGGYAARPGDTAGPAPYDPDAT